MITLKDAICSKLIEAKILPENTRRIVIDINYDSMVTVYYETVTSEKLMEITIDTLMQYKDEIKTKEIL